jgi:MFS family permease
MILLIGLIFATISGLAGGAVSDKVGRKRIVYISNTCTALVFLAFLLFHQLWEISILAALFGLSYGAYYSVDWALGCDVLPNPEDSAKDMAIWHISMVLPQSLILPVSGFLLGLFGKVQIYMPNGQNVIHYTEAGYTCIFLLASFFMLSGAVMLRNVRGVR